jgi:hypothetical protein
MAAKETFYELVGERLMGSLVSRTVLVCTRCYVPMPRNLNYWQPKLDDFKSRNIATTENSKKAERNGSFSKRVKMCCAKFRIATSARCVSLASKLL